MNLNITATSPDSKILEACREGDEAAMGVFFNKYQDLVYSAIHRWIGQYSFGAGQDEVADVFQSVMLALMKDNFKVLAKAHDPDKLGGLVYLVAFQGTGRYFEKKWKHEKKHTPATGNEPVPDDVLDKIDKKIKLAMIDAFVSNLKPLEQEIFELRFRDDEEYSDIAVQVGLSANNIDVIINRLKTRLRAYMKENYTKQVFPV